MLFLETPFPEVWLIEPDWKRDERGFFVRTFCEREFRQRNLNVHWPQANLTHTRFRGMIRGLHWQAPARPEIKLIRCSRGSVWDVVVDVRPESTTFGQWAAFELSDENARQLYVPAGFAHGFQCLSDAVELNYLMGAEYVPDLARGVRWDDPDLQIAWPLPLTPPLSPRDAALPGLRSQKSADFFT